MAEKTNAADSSSEALDDFMRTMIPYQDEGDLELMTSPEIANLITEHTGIAIDVNEIFLKLKGSGYQYKLIDNRFCWLFKRVA